ncbi:MAG: hypothetical protein JSW11_02435 [Candidatus Heimdallarchaeota archaeon]|nr:MAG: hypothetical protein JSW11_02435 [Candidatus Heimdallarchaeota archaeon]
MSDDAYVRDFKFRPFEGTYRGRIWRIWTVAWFNMTHQWHRSRVFKILIIFTIFILILPNMFLFSGIEELLKIKTANEIVEDHLWDTVRDFARFQVMITSIDETDPIFDTGYSIIMLIGVVMMGAGLISDDLKYKVSEIYDSKIDRYEYLLGKYGSLLIFGNLFYTFPCVLEWILLIVGIGGSVDLLAALPVLCGVILFTEILTLVLSSIILVFSSLTQRRLYAGLFAFMFFLSSTIVVQSLTGQTEAFHPIMYLDFFTVLSVFSYILAGEISVLYYANAPEGIIFDLTGLAGTLVIPTILLFIVGGLLISSYRVIWRNSHI